jgi:hypothetical protein
MDAHEMRRVWLAVGGDYSAAAEKAGTTRQNLTYHVNRLNEREPFVVPGVEVRGYQDTSPDAVAVRAYVRACLERAGIRKEAP